MKTITPPKDRLPANLLVADEVIRELRLDHGEFENEKERRSSAMRRLTYLRDTRRIPFIRVGHKTHLYPRAGIELFKKQNLVEAL